MGYCEGERRDVLVLTHSKDDGRKLFQTAKNVLDHYVDERHSWRSCDMACFLGSANKTVCRYTSEQQSHVAIGESWSKENRTRAACLSMAVTLELECQRGVANHISGFQDLCAEAEAARRQFVADREQASPSWASEWLMKVEPSGSLEIYAFIADQEYDSLNHLEETLIHKDDATNLDQFFEHLNVQDPDHQTLFHKFYAASTAALPKNAPTAAALRSRFDALVGQAPHRDGAGRLRFSACGSTSSDL